MGTVNSTTPLLDTAVEEAAIDIFESAIEERASNVSQEEDYLEDARWIQEARELHRTTVWYRRPSVSLLCVCLSVLFISITVSVTAKTILLLDLICLDFQKKEDSIFCNDPLVQEEASSVQSLTFLLAGLTSVIVAGNIGSASDRFGRKPVFIFIGLMALASKFLFLHYLSPQTGYHRYGIILANVVENLTGGGSVIVGVSNSYVIDIVDHHRRAISIGFVYGTLYTGLGLGPLIGGVLYRLIGSNYTILYFDLALGILFVVLSVFLFPESRSAKLRRKSQSSHLKRKASFSSLASNQDSGAQFLKFAGNSNTAYQIRLWILKVYHIFTPISSLLMDKDESRGVRPRVDVLVLSYLETMLMFVNVSIIPVLILYASYVFGATSEIMGYYMALIGFCKAICLYFIAPVILHFLHKVWKPNSENIDRVDFLLIVFALICDALVPLLVTIAKSIDAIFVSAIFGTLGALAGPTIQTAIMKYVPESRSGEIFGALALLKNFASSFGPSVSLFIYGKTVRTEPRLVFMVNFGVIIISTLTVMFLNIEQKREEEGILSADSQYSDYEEFRQESHIQSKIADRRNLSKLLVPVNASITRSQSFVSARRQ